MRPRLATFLSCVALLAAPSVARAQVLGPWHAAPAQVRFVDAVNGNDANNGLTPATAWQTVTFALSTTQFFVDAGIAVTYNLAPGTYSGAVESLPWHLAAKCTSIEATGPGVLVQGNGASSAILVDTPGVAMGPGGPTPDTQIRGLEIAGAGIGIVLDVGRNARMQANIPTAVEITQCDIHDNGSVGVRELGTDTWRTLHLIERSTIHHNHVIGVDILGGGVTSTIVRSNDIFTHETNVRVLGGASPALSCRPRIQSNFVRDSTVAQLDLQSCSPWIAANTVAFATMGVGINYFAPATEVIFIVDNIVWNPAIATQIAIAGGAASTVNSNDVFGGFAGGNVNILPNFVAVPTNLHLNPTPGVTESGVTAWVTPPLAFAVGGVNVPIDTRADVDGDPRVLDLNVDANAVIDMGADEIRAVRLTATAGADVFGNALAGTNVTLNVTGRNGDGVALYMWFRISVDPKLVDFFLNPIGNVMFDVLTPGDSILLATGTIVGGSFTTTLTLPPAPASPVEGEFYLQALVAPASLATGDMTNPLRLEANL
ncbi:MAG TPA: right-handed parallel beta-helix repeat-containing protein [Planctomycetota bacterium]|nr:right-handed parallel beta-helix repeat-containing protein [Planctomycetota bacterium]